MFKFKIRSDTKLNCRLLEHTNSTNVDNFFDIFYGDFLILAKTMFILSFSARTNSLGVSFLVNGADIDKNYYRVYIFLNGRGVVPCGRKKEKFMPQII
jgi:hypothetical protein